MESIDGENKTKRKSIKEQKTGEKINRMHMGSNGNRNPQCLMGTLTHK